MAARLGDSLQIVIIGGGMGGLSSALALSQAGYKHIHLFEMASDIKEVGAGINSTPNLSRVMDRYGVLQDAIHDATAVSDARILRGQTDEMLSQVDYDYVKKEFGYPFYVLHRASLQRALLTGVQKTTTKLMLGAKVVEIDFDKTRIRYKANRNSDETEWFDADVIVAADGVKSLARSGLLKRHNDVDHVVDTGQAAYRILLRRDMINEDPELLPFFEQSTSWRWIGPRRHIIANHQAYPISNHTIFNISTAHPDTNFASGPSTSWTTSGSKEQMLEVYKDFCPRVQKMLNLVPDGEVLEWKLRVHEPLETWTDHSIALVGDACHPTLPHLAQGAALAVEDGAVLGVVLGKLTSKDQIPAALKVYEELRKERCEWAVATAAENGRGLHVADGEAQKARDLMFKTANKTGGANPDKAVDKNVQTVLYAHDCIKNAQEKFDVLLKKHMSAAC